MSDEQATDPERSKDDEARAEPSSEGDAPKAEDAEAKVEAKGDEAKAESKGDDAKAESKGDDAKAEAEGDDAKAEAKGDDAKADGDAEAKPSRRKRRKKSAEGGTTTAAAATQASSGATAADDAKDDDGPERRDLPKWNRARVKRKAPKGEEQDAFQTSVRKAGRGLLQRPWAVLGIIVAVGGVVAGVSAWRDHSESKRADATLLLYNAVAYEARGQVYEGLAELTTERVRPLPQPVVSTEAELQQKVDEALTNLEEQAPDSAANEVADLVRAARLARAGDFEGAEKAYRGFLQRLPGHRLVFLAREGLVISLEAQQRYDDALAEVDKMLGGEGDFYRDQALWHQGRLLEAAGRQDEALEVYKAYAQEYPLEQRSLADANVRARLEELAPELVPQSPDAGLSGLSGLGGVGP